MYVCNESFRPSYYNFKFQSTNCRWIYAGIFVFVLCIYICMYEFFFFFLFTDVLARLSCTLMVDSKIFFNFVSYMYGNLYMFFFIEISANCRRWIFRHQYMHTFACIKTGNTMTKHCIYSHVRTMICVKFWYPIFHATILFNFFFIYLFLPFILLFSFFFYSTFV